MNSDGDGFPPPPSVSASEDDLSDLGHTIEEAVNSDDYAAVGSMFSLEMLLDRVMWPSTPTASDYTDFSSELEAREPFGTRLLRNWMGWGHVKFLRVRKSDVGTVLMFRSTAEEGGFVYAEVLVADDSDGNPAVVDMWTTASVEYFSRLLRSSAGFGNPLGAIKRYFGNEEAEPETVPHNEIRDLSSQGEYAEALRYFEGLPEKVQSTKPVQLARLEAAAALEEPRACSTAAAEARALFPDDISINMSLFDAYFVLNETDSALMVIDRIDTYAQDPYLDVMRGSIAELEGDIDRAVAWTNRFLEHDSTLIEPYYLLHYYSVSTEDYALRTKSLERILMLSSGELDIDSYEAAYWNDDYIKSKEYGNLKRRLDVATGAS